MNSNFPGKEADDKVSSGDVGKSPFDGWNNADEGDRGRGPRGSNNDYSNAALSPVLLDLSGIGFNIATLSSSSNFIDVNGDGYLNRTAWAGEGTGVLVLDADGDGKISRSNEYVFTEWDSSASGDLQAIKNVFDTNGNGKLDAGDQRWSEFKVSVNGQLVSLSSLGIVSIDLVPTGSGQTFSDGSAILGTAKYTKTDGTTGTVGDAVLVADTNGYILDRNPTVTTDGTTAELIVAYNPDGSLAFRNAITTSADGKSVTTKFDDDGNGTYDRSQSKVTVVDAAGIRTQTISNFNADGSLLSRTITVTSADVRTVTTTLDQDGDGKIDQKQIFLTNADGSTSTTTTLLSANGTVLSKETTTTTADGLIKSTNTDINGDGLLDRKEYVNYFNSATNRRVLTRISSRDGTELSRKDTTIKTAGRTTTTTTDIDPDGNATMDYHTRVVTTIAADGAILSDSTTTNQDLSLREKSRSQTSADGLSKTTSVDLTSDGVFDLVVTDVTVMGVAGDHTQTVQQKSADGTLLSKAVNTISADKKSITQATDANGDGAVDQLTTIFVGADGATTKISSGLAANGALIAKITAITSANGLSKTTNTDADGDGVNDYVTSDAITANPDGSRLETVTLKGASGTILNQTKTTTSADSLTQSVEIDQNGDGLLDRTMRDVITLSADGSRHEIATATSRDGTVLASVTTDVSIDRKTTTTSSDLNGDGFVDERAVNSTTVAGVQTVTTSKYSADGVVYGWSTSTVSADGMTKTSTLDLDGNGTNDISVIDKVVINANGSTIETVTATSSNGTALGKSVTSISANQLVVTVENDLNGDGLFDTMAEQITVLNSDGSTSTTISDYRGTALTDRTISKVSGNGLLSQVDEDVDGNGTIDRTVNVTKTLNANGTAASVRTVKNNNGALIAKTSSTVSADGKNASTEVDTDGDAVTDIRNTGVISAAGLQTNLTERFNAAGAVSSRYLSEKSANGLVKNFKSDLNNDGVFELAVSDTVTLDANGGQTRTVIERSADNAVTAKSISVTSADGLTKSTVWFGAGSAAVRSTSDVTILNADGSKTQTIGIFKAGGAIESRSVETVDAHKLNSILTIDVNGDGVVDQRTVTVRNNDGSVLQTSQDLSSTGAVIDLRAVKNSADGLHQSIDFDVDGNGVVDKRVATDVSLNANGSRTSTSKVSINGAQGLALASTTIIDTSANGLTIATQWDKTGSGMFATSQTDVTTLNADGSRTRIVSNFSASVLTSRYLTELSANGLSTTTKSDMTGSGTYSQISTDITTINADGTRTRTIASSTASGALLSSVTSVLSVDGELLTTTEQRAGLATRTIADAVETLADGSIRETVSTSSATGQLLSKVTTLTSNDRMKVTTDRDIDGDGVADQRELFAQAWSGEKTSTITDFKADGSIKDRTITTTSANGLIRTVEWDLDGNGTVDRRRMDTTAFNADGSRKISISDTDLVTGLLVSIISTKLSADGMSRTVTRDVNGDGTVDQTETMVADVTGATISTVTNNTTARAAKYLSSGGVYWKQAIAATVQTTSALDGRTKTIRSDYDGDGIFETVMVSQLQIDGSVSTAVTETNAGGTVIARGTITTTADAMTTTMVKDSNNDGVFEQSETSVTKLDGSVVLTKTTLNSNGTLSQTVVDRVGPSGSLITSVTTDGQGRKTRELVVALDGTSKTTTYDAPSAQILSISNATKAGLLSSASLYDPTSQSSWSTINQLYDASGKKYNEKQYNDDGTWIDVGFDAPSGQQSVVNYYSAAGLRTSSINYDLANTTPWTRLDQSYDAQGRQTSSLEYLDTGYRTGYSFDTYNSYAWSRIQYSYDTAAKKYNEKQYNDDGTWVDIGYDTPTGQQTVLNFYSAAGLRTSSVNYDVNNSVPWTRLDQTYDAQGRQTSSLEYLDSGYRTGYSFDTYNSYAWSRIQYSYDTAAKKYNEKQYNDDGTWVDIGYDTPTGQQTVLNFYSAAGLRTSSVNYDVNNSVPWTRLDQTYDAQGRQTSSLEYLDSGYRTGYSFDTYNSYWWSRIQYSYDAAALKYNEKQFSDDGSWVNINYVAATSSQQHLDYYNTAGTRTNSIDFDTANANSWSRIDQNFDAQGRTTYYLSSNDDGSKTAWTYDAANTQGWATIVQVFNPSGQLSNQDQYNDNGTRNSTIYDVTNTQSWHHLDQAFDSAGRLAAQTEYYDDGTRNENSYDVANAATWSQYLNIFDAAGRHYYTRQINDDGTMIAITLDAANVQPWWKIEQTFDSAGRVTVSSQFDDNGTRNSTLYDPANAQGWSRIEQVFNASAQLSSQITYNDNGTRSELSYDLTNRYDWYSYSITVGTNGRPSTQQYVYDDGSYINYQYNYLPTRTQYQKYDRNGRLIEQYDSNQNKNPVILDLNGDQHIDLRPFDATALTLGTSPVFDWDGDGIADGTAWAGPKDGFLAIDLGSDGQAGADSTISQARELAFSLWASDLDETSDVSDLEALRLVFDSNHDDVLDASDMRWGEFRVWQDLNQNGISEAGELQSMTQAGIKLINLLPSSAGAASFADGSAITGTSSFEKLDGTSYMVGDATLHFQPAVRTANAA